MGLESLLNRVLGKPIEEHPGNPSPLGLPENEYSMAVPVVVHEPELRAFRKLIEKEKTTAFMYGKVLSELVDDLPRSLGSLKYEDTLAATEEIIETWSATGLGEEKVVFAPVGTERYVFGFFVHCRVRAQSEKDPFEFSENASEAEDLANRIKSKLLHDSVLVATPKTLLPDI
jgi:hypothetical protein